MPAIPDRKISGRSLALACFSVILVCLSAACGSDDEALVDTNASQGPYALVFRGSAGDSIHLYAARGDDWAVRQLPAAFDGINPVWSPDFEYVADEDYDLGVVLRADGTDRHRLDAPFGPPFSWSPEGNELVYHYDDDYGDEDEGTLVVVSVDGSKSRSIARGSLPTWAPDGRIYFQQGMTIDTSAVKALDPDSGRVETVTRDTWLLRGTRNWSPDGRHVAYTNGLLGDDGKGLFLFEIGASDQPKRVLVEAPIDAYSWSSDGQRLAVVAGRRDPSAPGTGPGLRGYRWELRIVDLQGDTLGNASAVYANAPTYAITWSPDGTWIALQLYSGFDAGRETSLTDVWLVRPDGTGLRQLTSGVPTATSYGQAAWVPESVVAKAETAR